MMSSFIVLMLGISTPFGRYSQIVIILILISKTNNEFLKKKISPNKYYYVNLDYFYRMENFF